MNKKGTITLAKRLKMTRWSADECRLMFIDDKSRWYLTSKGVVIKISRTCGNDSAEYISDMIRLAKVFKKGRGYRIVNKFVQGGTAYVRIGRHNICIKKKMVELFTREKITKSSQVITRNRPTDCALSSLSVRISFKEELNNVRRQDNI